ncbi:hypothetical protein, partial [Klebsiella pneumoniae]
MGSLKIFVTWTLSYSPSLGRQGSWYKTTVNGEVKCRDRRKQDSVSWLTNTFHGNGERYLKQIREPM